MRWTEDQLAAHLKRTGVPGRPKRTDTSNPPFAMPRNFALGRLKTGEMNKTEAAYGKHLEGRKHAGEVLWYCFEGLKFRLADNTFYTPDYPVLMADLSLEIHEVKGFWQDDARVKIKVAASMFPFKFKAVTAKPKKAGGGWEVEEF